MLLVALTTVLAHAGVPSTATEDDGGGGLPLGTDATLPVTGGTQVDDPMKWPDVAGVVIQGYVACTGTLIAPDLVITAGHCKEEGGEPQAVILGTNDDTDPGERIAVTHTWVYPNSQTTGYDVAVMKLEHPSSYRPRVIANDCIEQDIVDGAEVQIVGYGATDSHGYRYTTHLMEATTEITDAECTGDAGHYGCNRNISPGGEIGAGGDGVDSCFGDSGGPLFLPTSRGTFLVGVTSRAWSDSQVPCGDGGIWVRPDAPALFEWLEETTGETLARPACMNPTAQALYFVKNHDGATTIDPHETSESFTYTITAPPVGGDATVDPDGEVRFSPNRGYEGETSVGVHIVDADGNAGDIVIPIVATSRHAYREATGQGVGCASVEGEGLLLAGLGALALGARRRRSRS